MFLFVVCGVCFGMCLRACFFDLFGCACDGWVVFACTGVFVVRLCFLIVWLCLPGWAGMFVLGSYGCAAVLLSLSLLLLLLLSVVVVALVSVAAGVVSMSIKHVVVLLVLAFPVFFLKSHLRMLFASRTSLFCMGRACTGGPRVPNQVQPRRCSFRKFGLVALW